jgi:hypothetical protein
MLRRITTLLAGASTAVLMVTGSAAASTGSAYYSADQAGYVATGAKFKFRGGHRPAPGRIALRSRTGPRGRLDPALGHRHSL